MIKLYMIPQWLRNFLGKEDVLTIKCANYLRTRKITFHHTFNEGKRTRTMRNKMIGFGCMTGIPDFLIFDSQKGKNGLAVELKVIYENGSKNRLTKQQKSAQETLFLKGWEVCTVYSFEEFTEAIN